MAQLQTTINSLIFPFEVDQITVSASEAFRLELVLNETILLDVTLTPGPDGISVIDDLAQLIMDRIPMDQTNRHVTTFRLSIKLNGALICSPLVLPCRLQLDESAADFIKQSFLTPCGFRKRTHRAAKEYLFFAYPQDESQTNYGTITSQWVDEDNHILENVQQMEQGTTVLSDDGFSVALDVSPSLVECPQSTSSLRLLTYEVYKQGRFMQYNLFPEEANMSKVKDFTFINAFGLRDTFHCFSTVQRETKVEYHAAVVHAHLKNYLIESIPSWKLKTGPMYNEEWVLLNDFCTALYVESAEGIPLTITSSELKDSDDWAYQREGLITFRESKNNNRNRVPRMAQTFDHTFDQSFR